MEYVLKPLKKLTGEPVTLNSDPTGEIIQLDPDRNVKYIFVLDVGEAPPRDVHEHMKRTMEHLKKFLGPDRCMIMPRRPNNEGVGIYQLEPVVE